ncbi:hypothetical protein EXU48_19150 [Occultella glacieicola]|uniref:YbaB/EbfC DNA-binding family protein n=1 Tax=Occultella glacieicola TaxID=2518684 RepID=A0ABY2E0J6_9MICO|nr:hypothetical protein [Occultella glacieicola]TDE90040.1 hypothetical protein EXU48_19150 [Occultella glacieicola]
MSQRIEASQGRLDVAEGRDRAEVVTVRLDGEGRFRDVAVLEAWSDEYEAEELGTAVVEAFVAASLSRTEQWGSALKDLDEEPEPRTRPLPPRHEQYASRLEELVGESSIDGVAATRGLIDQLESLQQAIDLAVTAVESRSQARSVGQDRQRGVEVIVDGSGGLVQVIVDPDFADRSHAFNISRALTEAITNGLAAAASESATALSAVDDLNAFAARVQDPQTMAAILKPDVFHS